MIDKLKFSVGIPAYKSTYLHECISSILNQSYTDFELIIVNDFSPYPIDEIVAQFNDIRIRSFKNKENSGIENVVNNFNKCLEKAKGDFFILMGDDDKMEPDYLLEFSKLIHKNPSLDIFHCRSKIIDETSKVLILTSPLPEYETIYDNMWQRMDGNRIQFIADFVYRTEVLKKNGGFFYMPLAWGTDDITVYLTIGKKGIAHTNKSVLNYRRHPVNISSIGSHELKMKAIILMQEWFHNFLQVKPSLEEDLIIYKYLIENIDRLIQKQKVYTISSSLNIKFLKTTIKWITKRKKYKVSILEIFYAFFIYLKEKKVKKLY